MSAPVDVLAVMKRAALVLAVALLVILFSVWAVGFAILAWGVL